MGLESKCIVYFVNFLSSKIVEECMKIGSKYMFSICFRIMIWDIYYKEVKILQSLLT